MLANRRLRRSIVLTCAGLALLSGALRAGDPVLEKAALAPPEAVSPRVREVLQAEVLRVRVEGKILAEFWLRRQIPLSDSPASGLGINFGKWAQSNLIGVVHLPGGWSDYKGKPVPPGVYTLRYGIQPADGNHMGVSVHRDFLLLIPASADPDPAALFAAPDLLSLSRKSSGTPHPSVMSLFPASSEITAPRISKNDLGQWTVETNTGGFAFGMVVIGKGEVES